MKISTEDIATFLQDNATKMLMWPEYLLERYIQFYRNEGAIGIVRLRGEIVGVGTARPVKCENQAQDRWEFDENGDTLFIDEIVATEKAVIPILWNMMVERFGQRPFVAGMRHDKLRVWDFAKYDSKMKLLLSKG